MTKDTDTGELVKRLRKEADKHQQTLAGRAFNLDDLTLRKAFHGKNLHDDAADAIERLEAHVEAGQEMETALLKSITALQKRVAGQDATISRLREALHKYRVAASRMHDRYPDGDELVRARLWLDLHSLEEGALDLLDETAALAREPDIGTTEEEKTDAK